MPVLDTNRTGSPLSAAQPAAGIAYAGSSAEAITTSGVALPAAAVAKRSIAAVSANGSEPEMVAARRPFGAGTSPIRITCAPPAAPLPVGESTPSASTVADGRLELPERRTGARIGDAISTDAAIAASQSSVGAIVTTFGWLPGAAEGYTASATPAASATGSPPATRV